MGASGDDFNAGRELLIAEERFAAGAVEEYGVQDGDAGEVLAESGFCFGREWGWRRNGIWLRRDMEWGVAFSALAEPPYDGDGADEEDGHHGEGAGCEHEEEIQDEEEGIEDEKEQA